MRAMRAAATNSRKNAPRRRPRQSRAHQTSRALQEAFVQLLVERGYAGITIREITLVAGTGLGSFYEYFASKDDLARVCLHLRSKALLAAMRDAAQQRAGQSMGEIVDAIVDALIDAHRGDSPQWGAHYLLERHLSGPDAYRKMYERFVDAWAVALAQARDPLPAGRLDEAARVSHTVLYGLFAHTFIGTGGRPDMAALAAQSRRAVLACLQAMRSPDALP
jgi:AcrR family transcriptional regulator